MPMYDSPQCLCILPSALTAFLTAGGGTPGQSNRQTNSQSTVNVVDSQSTDRQSNRRTVKSIGLPSPFLPFAAIGLTRHPGRR
jgi:hypothetical protein